MFLYSNINFINLSPLHPQNTINFNPLMHARFGWRWARERQAQKKKKDALSAFHIS